MAVEIRTTGTGNCFPVPGSDNATAVCAPFSCSLHRHLCTDLSKWRCIADIPLLLRLQRVPRSAESLVLQTAGAALALAFAAFPQVEAIFHLAQVARPLAQAGEPLMEGVPAPAVEAAACRLVALAKPGRPSGLARLRYRSPKQPMPMARKISKS
jgi:hypothetical protein